MRMRGVAIFILLCTGPVLWLGGCRKPATSLPDYARPLSPGVAPLRKLSANQWPNFPDQVDQQFQRACGRSLEWFDKPSSRQFFPIGRVTHAHARASVLSLRQLLHEANGDVRRVLPTLRSQFDLYMSVGWDNRGTVLFTGYYSPVFKASWTKTGRFRFPLYKRPSQLASDPQTGKVAGWRQANGRVVSPPTRRQIVGSNLMAGHELVWLRHRLDAYLIHVNGSARLTMTDGSIAYIGFAGTNGHEYTSVGRSLVAEGKIQAHQLSLATLRAYFRDHPQELEENLLRNDRFVFFAEYDGLNWPDGSLGFPVEPMRSLATDKSVFPRAGVVLVDTTLTTSDQRRRPFRQLMVDQDTGGAIRAPGRADIYMGVGSQAEGMAGRQSAEGRMYYLLLKPQYITAWTPKQGDRQLATVPDGRDIDESSITGNQ